jgi:RimJ/RimL family protein N-acetyltransferase
MLKLVPFAPAHFATVASWFASEGDVVQWGGPAVVFPLDAPQMQAMVDEGKGENPARLCWTADEDGLLVGHAQITLNWRHGLAGLCRVGVAPSARGRGLAVPMLRLVLEQAFALPEIERAELNVYTWNKPAIRAYERRGFVHEGVRRSSVRVGAERWDTAIMALLRAEWVAAASASGRTSPSPL